MRALSDRSVTPHPPLSAPPSLPIAVFQTKVKRPETCRHQPHQWQRRACARISHHSCIPFAPPPIHPAHVWPLPFPLLTLPLANHYQQASQHAFKYVLCVVQIALLVPQNRLQKTDVRPRESCLELRELDRKRILLRRPCRGSVSGGGRGGGGGARPCPRLTAPVRVPVAVGLRRAVRRILSIRVGGLGALQLLELLRIDLLEQVGDDRSHVVVGLHVADTVGDVSLAGGALLHDLPTPKAPAGGRLALVPDARKVPLEAALAEDAPARRRHRIHQDVLVHLRIPIRTLWSW